MDIYQELGIRTVVNGSATLTSLGGSLMPQEAIDAMVEAARAFVDIAELQRKVGEEIARLTHNEAAYVSCGCAAGLVLSTAACITGLDPEKRECLPHLEGLKNEVVVHKTGRVGYDFAIRQVGVRLVEIGTEERTTSEDLERALNERTAAVFIFPNANRDRTWLPLPEVITIAHEYGVPVIVDVAAQIPPIENLWHYTRMGADLALFSGGKGLRGPQSAGLVLGRKALVEAVAFNGASPFIGRPMKVGKEEMCGMLAAVRWALRQDWPAILEQYEDQVRYFIERFADRPGVGARRSWPSEAGQPMPRAELVFDPEVTVLSGREVAKSLMAGDPPIAVAETPDGSGIWVNPQTLEPGEERVIAQRLEEILDGA